MGPVYPKKNARGRRGSRHRQSLPAERSSAEVLEGNAGENEKCREEVPTAGTKNTKQ